MSSNIVCAVQHLKLANEYFNDWIREFPVSKGATVFKRYISKIEWIFNDLKSEPAFRGTVAEGLTREINSDVFLIPAIHDKIAQLPPEQRVEVEKMLDELILMHKAHKVNQQ